MDSRKTWKSAAVEALKRGASLEKVSRLRNELERLIAACRQVSGGGFDKLFNQAMDMETVNAQPGCFGNDAAAVLMKVLYGAGWAGVT